MKKQRLKGRELREEEDEEIDRASTARFLRETGSQELGEKRKG